MTAPPANNISHVLFLDDDTAFLQAIGELFGLHSEGQWQVHLAESSARALGILQDHPIDLVVTDIKMPVVDGEQFLHLLNRRYPNLRKVVMSGSADNAQRTACLNNGAELFLEKPRSAEGFQTAFAAIKELLRFQPTEGFRGVLRQVGLQDVLQMECLGRNSSILEVSTAHGRGQIFIKNGSIIHAHIDERTGEEAFNHLMALRGGEFSLQPFSDPPQQTIEGQWEFLIMEAARQRDEAAQGDDPNSPLPAPPPLQTYPSDHPDPISFLSLSSAPEDRVSSPTHSESADPPPPGPSQSLSQVEEFVLCSPEGEVLYQWRCQEIESRLKLLAFVAHTAGQIGSSLPLGQFDRLEILTPKTRFLAQLKPDRNILVASSPKPG